MIFLLSHRCRGGFFRCPAPFRALGSKLQELHAPAVRH